MHHINLLPLSKKNKKIADASLNDHSVLQITVDTDRTVVAFYKFLKKHASTPFKIQKPGSTQKTTESNASSSQESTINDAKDEL